MRSPTFFALLLRLSVICCSCTELFAKKAKSSAKCKSGSRSVFVHFIPVSCVSIAFHITKLRWIRKKNCDRIQPCCIPNTVVKKSVTPVSGLAQQLEPVFNALNIFMYFCGTSYMDNMFHKDGL